MNSLKEYYKTKPKITVAIDGFSSSGKSTMAKHLAKEVGYRYIDSGAMYRGITLKAMRLGLVNPMQKPSEQEEKEIAELASKTEMDFRIMNDGSQHLILDGEDVEDKIRGIDVSSCVSEVSAIGGVREVLVELQQDMGVNGGIVMDGRDIGTTVFPSAELKIYVTASAEMRAKRRYKELLEKDQQVEYSQIYDNVVMRDNLDINREISPLRQAEDAVHIDNSDMSPEEQNQLLLNLFDKAVNKNA